MGPVMVKTRLVRDQKQTDMFFVCRSDGLMKVEESTIKGWGDGEPAPICGEATRDGDEKTVFPFSFFFSFSFDL